ncbi:MAG: OadG family protein [Clostridia bacterium]|nr:OadG family protein [Clostridia bacterium]
MLPFLMAAEAADAAAKGTKIAIPQGLLLALVGFVLVLIVLALLMGFIYLLSYIVRKIESAGKKAVSAQETGSASAELAPGSSGDIKLYNVDDRTAAMVMAIVADELQTPLNELRFISIKEVSEEEK